MYNVSTRKHTDSATIKLMSVVQTVHCSSVTECTVTIQASVYVLNKIVISKLYVHVLQWPLIIIPCILHFVQPQCQRGCTICLTC